MAESLAGEPPALEPAGGSENSLHRSPAEGAAPLAGASGGGGLGSSGTTGKKGDAADGKEVSRCLVYCRLRPRNAIDFHNGGSDLVALSGNRVVVKDERHYDFDGTFGQECTQDDVFQTVAAPCVRHAFKGFCSALMCYGQTGTGKSFTMCNTKPGQEGIIPRSALYIYDQIQRDPARRYTVVGQFIQIYRDHLGDLMVGSGRDKVDIRFDTVDGVTLSGCSSHELADATEFMSFYHEGNQRRVVTATAMNPESSRGHTAMVIWIHSESVENPLAGRVKGKITFIDLAGYERFSKTGISNANPIMKDEAKTINASLLSLGHVVTSLSNGERHIPWRNSKLTRLLQDSIGGRSRTSIILTIGPSSDHLHETTNSLQFGLRAMAVKVEAKMSITVDYEKLALKLQDMLHERDERIGLLEVQIANRDADRQELLERYQRDRELLKEQFEVDLRSLSARGATEEQISKLKEVYSIEVQNLNEQQTEEIEYQDEVHTKEISSLIKKQEHQEAMRRAEMKLAQERIIEEFQNKLLAAREGTNEDLIAAIRQLAEKDAIIASRANDTARLHEHIAVLTEQVKSLGCTPAREASFPETFLDVGQVEELQRRFEGEIERQHTKMVELRAQLDRMSLICNDRMIEISGLQDENASLRKSLTEAGVIRSETEEELRQLNLKRACLIDPLELETLRVSMQADIDELQSHNEALQKEVQRLKEEELAQPHALLMSRVRGNTLPVEKLADSVLPASTATSTPGDVIAARGGEAFTVADSGHLRADIQRLSEEIVTGNAEKAALRKMVRQLQQRLGEIGATDTAVSFEEGADGCEPAALLSAGEAPGGATSRTDAVGGVAAEAMDSPAAACPRAPNADIALLLQVSASERDALWDMLARQEQQMAASRAALEHSERVSESLRQQLRLLDHTVEDTFASLQPAEGGMPLSAYMDLVRHVRWSASSVAARLLARTEETPPEDVGQLLEEKDSELQLKDEMILEKVALANYMAKLVSRLVGQMESLGLTPCCTLPESFRALGELDTEVLEALRERQAQLEENLRREDEEKRKLNNLLQALSEERSHQAAVFASYKSKVEEDLNLARERNRELEKKENIVAAAMTRIAQEKSQKERILEEAARRATREMMALQARLAKTEEPPERLGLFGKLRKKFLT